MLAQSVTAEKINQIIHAAGIIRADGSTQEPEPDILWVPRVARAIRKLTEIDNSIDGMASIIVYGLTERAYDVEANIAELLLEAHPEFKNWSLSTGVQIMRRTASPVLRRWMDAIIPRQITPEGVKRGMVLLELKKATEQFQEMQVDPRKRGHIWQGNPSYAAAASAADASRAYGGSGSSDESEVESRDDSSAKRSRGQLFSAIDAEMLTPVAKRPRLLQPLVSAAAAAAIADEEGNHSADVEMYSGRDSDDSSNAVAEESGGDSGSDSGDDDKEDGDIEGAGTIRSPAVSYLPTQSTLVGSARATTALREHAQRTKDAVKNYQVHYVRWFRPLAIQSLGHVRAASTPEFRARVVATRCLIDQSILDDLDLYILRGIGQGANGSVFSCMLRGDADVAVKFGTPSANSEDFENSDNVDAQWQNEARIALSMGNAGVGPSVRHVFYLPCLIAQQDDMTKELQNPGDPKSGEPNVIHVNYSTEVDVLVFDEKSGRQRSKYVTGYVPAIVMERVEMTFSSWIHTRIKQNTPAQLQLTGLKLKNMFSEMGRLDFFHLDLKPDNMMVNVSRQNPAIVQKIYVTDFGLSYQAPLTGEKLSHYPQWPNAVGFFGFYLVGPSSPSSPYARSYDMLTLFASCARLYKEYPSVQILVEPLKALFKENNPNFPEALIDNPAPELLSLVRTKHYIIPKTSRKDLEKKHGRSLRGLSSEVREEVLASLSSTADA